MKSKHKQRGWLNFIAPIAAAAIGGALANKGGENTNEANQNINSAQMAFNAEEAAKKRAWDEQMRATQYQTAVGDLRASGLNPMLAYQQGGAGMPGGATANAGSMIPMQNATQAGINGAMAAAQIANIHAQTDKIKAETPVAVANVGNIEQQTKNLKEGLTKITEEIRNVRMDTLEKEERVTLIRAQQQLTNIQKDLTKGQITFVQAQEAVAKVEAQLKNYAVPEARNTANFQTKMGEGVGVGTKEVNNLLQIFKGMLGK